MKFTKIALACGLAFSAMSAHAVDATASFPNNSKQIFVGGASAVDNFFSDTVSTMLTTPVRYRANDASGGAKAYRAFSGAASAGITGVTEGQHIVLIKRSANGSVMGVNPVANSEAITTIDLTNCDAVTETDYDFACAIKGDDTGANGAEVPDFGLSDVEPAMFTGFNLKSGVALTTAQLGAINSQPVNQQGMGIVATDAVAATTHISRATYGSMLAGKLKTWETIDGSTDPVIVCRRTNGSGTQASYNWMFSGFPCTQATLGHQNAAPAVSNTLLGTNYGGGDGSVATPYIVSMAPLFGSVNAIIVENSGSGGVRDCLEAAQNQTDFTAADTAGDTYTYKFSELTSPGKAIGVLSMDSYVKLVGKGASYRYLDGAGVYDMATQALSAGPGTGIAPSKDNIVNGRYDFVVELSAQNRISGTDAEKLAFWNQLVKNLGSTQYTGDATGNFTTVPNAFATLPTTASYTAEPGKVSKYTRGANTCSPMVWQPSL